MLTAYLMSEKGFLPNPGGWADQPAKFIEAITLLDSAIERIRKDKDGKH